MRWPGLQPPAPLGPVDPAAFTEGRLIYAVGDIHGRSDLLDALLARIGEDAQAAAPPQPPLLVFLGDYVDRGPDAFGVIDRLARLEQGSAFQVEALRGNHEAALLGFLADVDTGPVWSTWGGDATLRSYGVAPPAPNAPLEAWEAARGDFAARMPAAHRSFLNALPLSLIVGGYVFVHAGVRPGVSLDDQAPEDLLMIRSPFLEHETPHARVVVHGHTPEAEPFLSDVRIGLDTGAYATGALTAARLWAEEIAILQT